MGSARPIFIVGCPRSGTTLLSAMLHAHPNIAMPPETRFLLPTYQQRERFGDLHLVSNRRLLGRAITGRGTRFRDLRLDRRAVVQAVVDAPPTLGSAFATVWQEFARDRGKPRWGEKRPAYWGEMDVIMRLFPTAQIIHLVRDPRSCVASLEQVSWWGRGVLSSTAVWVSADRELSKLGRQLPARSYHMIQFEQLVGAPRATLRALCEFLDEDFDERMLDHQAAAEDIVPSRKTWHARVRQQVDADRTDAWRDVLSARQIGLVETVARRRMNHYGYRPSELGSTPRPLDLLGCAARMAKRRVQITKRRRTDARLRRRFPMPLAAEL